MQIHHYDRDNGAYLGTGTADQSPLDPPGVYLVPAFATEVAPPYVPEGKYAAWSRLHGYWELRDIPQPEPDPEPEPPIEDPMLEETPAGMRLRIEAHIRAAQDLLAKLAPLEDAE